MLWCMPISVRILTYEHYINTALHVLHTYTQVAIMDDIKCGNSLVSEGSYSFSFVSGLSLLLESFSDAPSGPGSSRQTTGSTTLNFRLGGLDKYTLAG